MTDKPKWTMGGWIASGTAVFVDGNCIALTDTDNASRRRMEANAHLIAAAPDLADCAEELVDAVGRLLVEIPYEAEDIRGTLDALRDDAEAALAKARGET